MSGAKYLADTNAFIYLLQKHSGLNALLDSEWLYSFITEIELLGKPGIKAGEVKVLRDVLAIATKTVHTEAINVKAIFLKQQYAIKTPDALIAATALQYGIPLLTADSGFTKIKGLDMVLIEFW